MEASGYTSSLAYMYDWNSWGYLRSMNIDAQAYSNLSLLYHRSITGGEGAYSIEFSHYDIVPQRIMEGIVARAGVKEEKEEE